MGDSDNNAVDNRKRRQSDQVRLESWKAIARYLNRSVRTVRRWEVSEGLPVFRHQHKKGHSVHAYCSQLDAWRLEHAKANSRGAASESAATENVEQSASPAENVPKLRAVQVGSTLLLVFVAAFMGTMVARLVPLDRPAVGTEASPARVIKDDLGAPIVSQLDDVAYWSESVARKVVLPVLSAWVGGRVEDAIHEGQKINERLPNFSPATQDHIVEHLIDISLAMGRVDDARAHLAILKDPARRYELQTMILFAVGDKEGMRAHLQHGAGFEIESTALLMAMAGLADEAIELESTIGSAETRSRRAGVIRAMAAQDAGNDKFAMLQFRNATDVLGVTDMGYFFVALEKLSGILRSEGRRDEAIDILEKTMPEREAAAFNKSGLFWLMCQRQLARQYREVGRERDAAILEDELRAILAFSDEDFPLLRTLTEA